jgi:hypothetical protein
MHHTHTKDHFYANNKHCELRQELNLSRLVLAYFYHAQILESKSFTKLFKILRQPGLLRALTLKTCLWWPRRILTILQASNNQERLFEAYI